MNLLDSRFSMYFHEDDPKVHAFGKLKIRFSDGMPGQITRHREHCIEHYLPAMISGSGKRRAGSAWFCAFCAIASVGFADARPHVHSREPVAAGVGMVIMGGRLFHRYPFDMKKSQVAVHTQAPMAIILPVSGRRTAASRNYHIVLPCSLPRPCTPLFCLSMRGWGNTRKLQQ